VGLSTHKYLVGPYGPVGSIGIDAHDLLGVRDHIGGYINTVSNSNYIIVSIVTSANIH